MIGQVVATTTSAPVRGPKYAIEKRKTPILTQDEARALLASINTSNVVGLRDRAIIATMIHTLGRVGAVVKMRVEDYYAQGRRGWMRLHEKSGKRHEMPCNYNLEAYIDAMTHSDVYRMIRRRTFAAGIRARNSSAGGGS